MSEPKVKSILEIKPIDLVGATRMFEVKPNVKTIYAGWTRLPLSHELSIDITTVDYSNLVPNLLPKILCDSIGLSKSAGPHTTPDGVSIYYVMNAADANAVVASIKQYAEAHPIFPKRFNVDEIITHIGNIEVELLQRSSSGGRRKIKRRQIKKMKTKRRQIKKMKTTSKK
jgi:hypothetical protein